MLNYYIKNIKTKKITKFKIIKLVELMVYFIILLKNYQMNNKTQKNLSNKLKFKSKIIKLPISKEQTVFNRFLFFLSRSTINKQKNLKRFIYKNKINYYVKHLKVFKKIKQKIPHQKWKSLKKLLKKQQHYLIKKTIQHGQSFNKNTKKIYAQTIFNYLNNYGIHKFKNKNFFKLYKTKKNQLKSDFKTQYNIWVNNNYKKYFYVTSIKNKLLFKKILSISNLISQVILHKFKKRIIKIIKKKSNFQKISQINIIKSNLLQTIKFEKFNKFFFKKTKKVDYKYKFRQKTKKNIVKIADFVHKDIIIKKYLFNIKINNQKKLKIKKTNNKFQIKKIIFNMCFNTTQDYMFDMNKVPNIFLSNTPQLLLNNFNSLNKKKKTTNLVLNEALTKIYKENQKYANTVLLNNMGLNINNANITNNYNPLYFFKINDNYKNNLTLKHAKLQLYNYNINNVSTAKYKTFFVFFLLNYLEHFLLKKIWLHINTKDPINLFWKNHINTFLHNNLYLYKKFNKIISVRELLEILWIVFSTHDLQILLLFLKKKFENAHFKKHKKILSIFFDILRKNAFIFYLLKIRGFFFDIRGKVGVSGNAKKRHHSFSIGKITTTSQNTGSYFQQINVWTPTGQMGITCIIQY